MTPALHEFARLGLVHHMLYSRCVTDPDYHATTLEALVGRTDIETFDCCLPPGADRQRRLIRVIRESGKKNIVFAIHLFPLRTRSLATTSRTEQAEVRATLLDLIAQAAAIGASGFIFASGGPPYAEGTPAHHAAFLDLGRWLCERLGAHDMVALLEPFDFDHDKRFLYGPLDRNIEYVAQLATEFPNIGVELDMAHLPLMREDFASAIRRAAPWIRRVHLGNCVSRFPTDPFYGDRHPPIGYPLGEIDVPQLTEILSTLKEIKFLDQTRRGDLVLELNPFPGRSEDDSVADNFQRVRSAWQAVPARCPAITIPLNR